MAMTKARLRQVSRIRSIFRNAEKGGFTFPEGYKQSVLSQNTNKLRHIKSQNIYRNATYKTKSGETISGYEGQRLRRSEAGKKAANTRKIRKQINSERTLRRIRASKPLYEGDIILDKMYDLISSHDGKAGDILSNILSSEIRKYGRNAVLRALSQVSSEVLELAEVILYYSDANTAHSAARALADLIKGTIESTDEAKEYGDVFDYYPEEYYE